MYYMLDMLTCLYNNLSILEVKLGCMCCSKLVQYTCRAVPSLILSLNSTKAQADTEHRFGWHEFFITQREREMRIPIGCVISAPSIFVFTHFCSIVI